MKNYLLFIVLIFSFFNLQHTFSQCTDVEKKCTEPDNSFKVSSSSRSLELFSDKRTVLIINAYGGKDYYISVYAKSKMGMVQFRLKDPDDNSILYDNSSEGFTQNKIISVSSTKKLILELFAPNGKFSEGKMECVGVLIAYRKSVF